MCRPSDGIGCPASALCAFSTSNVSRLRLLKIAARVVEWKTKVLVHLPSACPDRAILRLALGRLPRLVI